MLVLTAITVLLASSQCAFVASQGAGCEKSQGTEPTGVWTQCKAGNYQIPGTLNAAEIDPNTAYFTIDSFKTSTVSEGYSLPALQKLVKVMLYSVNKEENQPRFSMSTFLKNNKDHIETLELNYCKVQRLTAEDFSGFSKLRKLKIFEGQLTDVAVSTFEQLNSPHMEILELEFNPKFLSLDWSFLKPIAGSLKRVTVAGSGISYPTLTCSIPFTLQSASYIKLGGNKHFHRMPTAIYQTFNTANKLDFDLDGMVLCPLVDTCSCCVQKEFVAWLKANNKVTVSGTIYCGKEKSPLGGSIMPELDFSFCPAN